MKYNLYTYVIDWYDDFNGEEDNYIGPKFLVREKDSNTDNKVKDYLLKDIHEYLKFTGVEEEKCEHDDIQSFRNACNWDFIHEGENYNIVHESHYKIPNEEGREYIRFYVHYAIIKATIELTKFDTSEEEKYSIVKKYYEAYGPTIINRMRGLSGEIFTHSRIVDYIWGSEYLFIPGWDWDDRTGWLPVCRRLSRNGGQLITLTKTEAYNSVKNMYEFYCDSFDDWYIDPEIDIVEDWITRQNTLVPIARANRDQDNAAVNIFLRLYPVIEV